MTQQKNEEEWLKYLYPGTDVLINKFNCQDTDKLKELETSITFDKLLNLKEQPIDMNFDKEHLKAIHKYLFDDIYPFAGEYRKVNMQKMAGNFLFVNNDKDFDDYLDNLFNEINILLKGCNGNKYQFCDTLSRLYTKLIYCHPFREGNGRSTREFVREFSIVKSKEVGLGSMELDWSLIDKAQLDQYVAIAHIFPGGTTQFFFNALVPMKEQKKMI